MPQFWNADIMAKDGNSKICTVSYNYDSTIQGVLDLVHNAGYNNVLSLSDSVGGTPLSLDYEVTGESPTPVQYVFYDVTPDPTYSIVKMYHNGVEYETGGGGGCGGHDYSWETKTITSGAVELGLRTIVEPNSNFTLNAPSDLQDGMEYVLRCVNGSTAYTLTLGTGFVNDFGTDLTLHANHSDQFTFVAYDGNLELQPEYMIEGGGRQSLVTTPGIYRDKENGLISVSSDGTTWMTIADKNLGATEVFTKQDVNNGKAAYLDRQLGFIYQWGRNFPFSWNSIICQDTQVSYNGNQPGKFIAYKGDWLSSSNNNLRGAVTNTNVARKGPCDIGWHVPSRADMTQLDTILQAIGRDGIYSDPFSGETNDGRILKFTPAPMIDVPSNGQITYTSAKSGGWWPYNSNNYIQFWLSDYNGTYGYLYSDDDDSEGDPAGNYSKNRSTGAPIRPFKNEGVQPTTAWEVLYQPS